LEIVDGSDNGDNKSDAVSEDEDNVQIEDNDRCVKDDRSANNDDTVEDTVEDTAEDNGEDKDVLGQKDGSKDNYCVSPPEHQPSTVRQMSLREGN